MYSNIFIENLAVQLYESDLRHNSCVTQNSAFKAHFAWDFDHQRSLFSLTHALPWHKLETDIRDKWRHEAYRLLTEHAEFDEPSDEHH